MYYFHGKNACAISSLGLGKIETPFKDVDCVFIFFRGQIDYPRDAIFKKYEESGFVVIPYEEMSVETVRAYSIEPNSNVVIDVSFIDIPLVKKYNDCIDPDFRRRLVIVDYDDSEKEILDIFSKEEEEERLKIYT